MLAKTAAVVGRTDYTKKLKKKKQSKFGFLGQEANAAPSLCAEDGRHDDDTDEDDGGDNQPAEVRGAAAQHKSPLSLADLDGLLDRSLSPVVDHEAAIVAQLARLTGENDEKEAENGRKRKEIAELLAHMTVRDESF
jgi:hypothetical protein